MPMPEGLVEALRPQLLKVFPPALLGRLVDIAYYPLADEVLGRSSVCSSSGCASACEPAQGADDLGAEAWST